jgi:sugar lactone lactonase YvrE
MSSRVLVLIALLVVLPVDAAAAQSFTQLPGEQGCLVSTDPDDSVPDDCAETTGLLSPRRVVVAPDGAQLYVAGSDGVTVFARDPGTGALTRASCVTDNGGDGRPGSGGLCVDGDALAGASGIAIAPDGRSAFVTASDAGAISWFSRDPIKGELTQRGCLKARPDPGERCAQARGLRGAADVVVSPDGARVYTVASANSAVAVFDVDDTTGALIQRSCASDSGSDGACDRVPGLQRANGLSLSPDGRNLYVTSARTGALVTLDVDAATGALSARGCLLNDAPAGGPCTATPQIAGASQAVITGDGRSVLVVASDAGTLVSYARDPGTGALTQQQCLQHSEPAGNDSFDPEFEDEDEPRLPGCESARALADATALAVSADGRGVFVSSPDDYVTAFARSDAGVLTEFACAETDPTYRSCVETRGAYTPVAIAASPDARNLYVVSEENTLAVFAATVEIARARLAGRSVRVVLACPAARSEGCRGRISAAGVRGSRAYSARAGRTARVSLRLRGSRHPRVLRLRATDRPGATSRILVLRR